MITWEAIWSARNDSVWFSNVGAAEQAAFHAKRSAHMLYVRNPELRDDSKPVIFSIDTETGDYKFLLSDETRPFLDSSSVVKRGSHVEPVNLMIRIMFYAIRKVFGEDGRMGDWTRGWSCRWRIDTSPVGGSIIPVDFASRSSAIDFEINWLNKNFL